MHRPIVLEQTGGSPPLPPYVPRAHDDQLAQVVAGSSAGKTRACWEAMRPLRDRPEEWRLWHPFDPTRPEAAEQALDQVGPYTVVWLNETQEYLGGEAGERVAAKLRSLLGDPGRAPVLGTLWPDHHAALTGRSGSQVRQLLDGTMIALPEMFTGSDLAALRQAAEADARLAQAVKHAEDGQITQYLAGGPELVERFGAAPACSTFSCKAVITRSGMRMAGNLTDVPPTDGGGKSWGDRHRPFDVCRPRLTSDRVSGPRPAESTGLCAGVVESGSVGALGRGKRKDVSRSGSGSTAAC